MSRREHPGLIVRQKTPLNLEFQFATLSDWLTPTDQFYVRSHFPAPRFEGDAWRLDVDGAVGRPLSLSVADLAGLPQTTFAAALECAGNGRVFYEPVREGLQWQHGAVGNAEWTGVLLRDVLAAAGVEPSACEVVLIGADRGVVDGGKKTASPGPIAFARSIPIDKALGDGVLLATAMNGEPLTEDHGHPLRAVVGGWYGMAWVKWIQAIRVVERPFAGYWQSRDYFRWERVHGEPVLVPLGEMEVKAQIARPVDGATLRTGVPFRIFGAAWSGEAPVAGVEVQTEVGGPWRPATLVGPESAYGWRLWELRWTPTATGRHVLRCRATDRAGNRQPEIQQPDRESYLANWMVPITVTVLAESETEAQAVGHGDGI